MPVGSRQDGGVERPCAVSEYLLDRMVLAGAGRICMVISPGKHDILAYYGADYGPAHLAYVVQPQPPGSATPCSGRPPSSGRTSP